MGLFRFEVQTYNACGAALLKSGDFQLAIEAHRRAQGLLAASAPSLGNQRDFRYEQALTLAALVLTRSAEFLDQQNRRGPRRPGQGSPPTAPLEIQADFRQAVQLLDGLLQEAPDNADYLLALARCQRSILPAAWANAEERTAATAKQHAIEILQQLAAQKPDDLTVQFELADTLAMTAQADTRKPLPDSDVAVLKHSLQLVTSLHEKCPTAPEYGLLLSDVQQKLGVHFLAARQWDDAHDHLTRAADELELLVASSPTNPLFQTSLARVRWELADSLQHQGSFAPARQLLEKAIAQYGAFRESEAGRRTSVGLLVGLHRELARVLEQLGEKQLASDASRTADRLRDSSR
jgi:tetratricopeptide (TPR) repeat protein